jgi:hypothetical protein
MRGRGCCPCVFDYYQNALERWKKAVRDKGGDPEAILAGGENCVGPSP